MTTTAYRRYICTVVAATTLLALMDLLLLPSSNISVSWSSVTDTAEGVGLGVFYIMLAGCVRTALRRVSGSWRTLFQKIASGLENAGIFLALCFAFSAANYLAMYLAAATPRPLMDAQLAAFDWAFGFDWPALVQLANSSPFVAAAMVFCYGASSYLITFVALYHLLTDNRERLFEFAATLVVSLVITNVVMFIVPSAGAYAFHHPDAATFSHFTAIGGLDHLSTLEHLRSSQPFVFELSEAKGLTSFPSFHIVLGILSVYAIRKTLFFFPILLVNLVMAAATIPEGGHHFADLLGGVCVAVASIALVDRINRSSRLSFRSRDDLPISLSPGPRL